MVDIRIGFITILRWMINLSFTLMLLKQSPIFFKNEPETRGKTEIKIYPHYPQVILKFRSLDKRVFKPFFVDTL